LVICGLKSQPFQLDEVMFTGGELLLRDILDLLAGLRGAGSRAWHPSLPQYPRESGNQELARRWAVFLTIPVIVHSEFGGVAELALGPPSIPV